MSASLSRSTAPRRILLIDDTPEIAELLTYALRDAGYEVIAFGYTDTVNDLIAKHHANALVLDCSSYDMSEALFDLVRGQNADLPITIITDTPELADPSLRKRKAQKVLVVPKPFTASQVARALDQLFG
jgi:DNA-binding response OmpR family regulator